MLVLRPLLAAIAAACVLALTAFPATARLLVEIDKSAQRMIVSLDGALLHDWPVSTGLRAHDTPAGAFTPFRMEKDHFSREWDDAPMPHSIFFTRKGHAIHGTTHLRAIGRPASHGCVRLEPDNARVLFELVRQQGLPNTRVVLTGVTPAANAPAMVRRAPEYGERPGYVEARPDDGAMFPLPRPFERGYPREEHTGYWVQRPDGSREFVDRERAFRPLPPPPFFFGRPPWE